jgi:hypothetical protein
MKDFTLYPEAFELKELGFDEPCLKFYATEKLVLGLDTDNGDTNSKLSQYNPLFISAPTYSQVFRWFREKYNTAHSIDRDWDEGHLLGYEYTIDDSEGITVSKTYHTYEEAEKECLIKLIEIVKENGK